MTRLTVGFIELDECPRCLGMWFDKGELQEVLAAAFAQKHLQQRFAPKDGPLTLPRAACPRCIVGQLSEREEHGHPVSGCNRCEGVWVTTTVLSTVLGAEAAPPPPPAWTDAPAAPPKAPQPAPSPVAVTASPVVAPAAIIGAPAAAMPPPPEDPAPAEALLHGCVACGQMLEPASHEQQQFHACGDCGALYFARGGLPFFIRHSPQTWPAPRQDGPEPRQHPQCPACGYAMQYINWEGHGARVLACTDCWGTFVPASAVRRLVNPQAHGEAPIDGAANFIWRVFDAVTEWLVNPPNMRTPNV